MKSTKKALAFAVLSLVVCVSMLVGTTFAWFTDNVVSANNIIKSGNLEISLEWEKGTVDPDVADWKDASKTAIFDYDNWEPGYTCARHVKIENEGTLALKYVVTIEATGEVSKLADVIDVYYVDPAVQLEERADVAAEYKLGTLSDVLAGLESSATGILLAGDADTITLVLKMQESAGNEYENLSIGDAFAVKLFATQLNSEVDSFDKDYDAGAYLPIVYTEDELAEAVADGGDVKVGGTITDTTLEPYSSTRNVVLLYRPTKDATFSGGKVILDNSTANWGFVVDAANGVDVTVKDTEIVGNNNWNMHNIVAPEATLTIENVKVLASGGNGIYVMGGGEAILNNVSVAQDGLNAGAAPWAPTAVALSGGSTVTVNSGVYEGTTYGAYIYNSGGNLVINGGSFKAPVVLKADGGYSTTAAAGNITINGGNFDGKIERNNGRAYITINGGTFTNFSVESLNWCIGELSIKGGTFDADPSAWVADGHKVVKNTDGTWTVEREYIDVVPAGEDKGANGAALADAITATTEASFIKLPAGAYKMPSIGGSKDVTIVGTKDTVIDLTAGAYMDGSKVAFEGVTIKGSTGMSGSDYAAMYTPDVTYVNCTFDGAFRIGRDGATFINCTFTNLGNDYVWNMNNDTVFEGCTFNTDGKALLLYADGPSPDGVATVVVKNCKFNATKGATAGAIANQNCAAIEIQNYGCSIELISEGNTHDSNFSGMWRIKTYNNRGYTVTVNGTEYTSIAVDGKTMTIDADKNVTVNG